MRGFARGPRKQSRRRAESDSSRRLPLDLLGRLDLVVEWFSAELLEIYQMNYDSRSRKFLGM